MKKVPVMLYEPKRQSFQSMRRRIAIACICLVVLFQLHYYHQATRSQQQHLTDENDDLLEAVPAELARTGNSIDRLHKLAWTKLVTALESHRPLTATSLRVTEHVPVISLHSPHRLDEFDAVPMDPKTLVGMSSAHFHFVNQIRYRFDSSLYLEGKRGIVMTAAGGQLGAALVQLRLLRRTRSRLPVDVFLVGREDYDAEICEKLMPSLNARCRVLQNLMGHASSFMFEGKSAIRSRNIVANEPLHKLLALFFSDWEENLMLGYDTLVFNNPDGMFQEEPYLSHGLIIWPDQWVSSISPKMDHIQRKRFPNSNEKSSTVDMGQLVVSKSMQRKTLLLAIYYTFYGPKLYDVLLRQSTAGEEGSQAIKVAARYFDAPFFVVRRDVEAVGFTKLNAKAAKKTSSSTQHTFQGVATLQHFALEDYHRQPYEQHRPAFIRASKPILDPLTITQSSAFAELQSGGSNKAQHRLWQTFSARHESNGWQDSDPENALWYEMETVACHQLAPLPEYAERAARACQEIATHRTKL